MPHLVPIDGNAYDNGAKLSVQAKFNYLKQWPTSKGLSQSQITSSMTGYSGQVARSGQVIEV